MKKITLTLIIACILTSCSFDNREYFNNQVFTVASIGIENGFTRNKFHTPTVYHTVLFRSIKDTTTFMEVEVSPNIYYNVKKDDVVSIDYVLGSKGGGSKHSISKITVRNQTTGFSDSITNHCCIQYHWITIKN